MVERRCVYLFLAQVHCANVAEHGGVTVQVKVVRRDGGADAQERRRYVA